MEDTVRSSSYAETTVSTGAEVGAAQVVCVFVHGRTQSPAEMIEQVIRHLDAPTTRFVLPKSDGAAWYNARAIDPLTEEASTELNAALAALEHTIAVARADSPQARLVLAGFSQGACLSMEYMMRHGSWDGAACLFTGCRVGVAADDRPVTALPGMPIYASNGDKDPWIPAANFSEMCLTLIEGGARLRTEVFPGRDHGTTPTECAALNEILANVAAGIPVFDTQEAAQ